MRSCSKRVDLDLDLDQMAGGGAGACQYSGDTARDRDMVVLDEDGVVEPEAVIEAAAAAHRIFLQGAQARRGLAGAAYARAGAGDRPHIGRGRGGDAGEVAEEIECGALCAKQRPRIAFHRHQHRLRSHGVAVALGRRERHGRVEGAKRRRGERQAGDRAGLAGHHDGASAQIRRHGGGRRHVAGAAEILGELTQHRLIDGERRQEGTWAKGGGHDGSEFQVGVDP